MTVLTVYSVNMLYFPNKKDIHKGYLFYLPKAGLEPARGCPHKILSLARLPISSLRHKLNCHIFIITEKFQISNKILKNFLTDIFFLTRLIKLY